MNSQCRDLSTLLSNPRNRLVRCYDNASTIDRYTVLYLRPEYANGHRFYWYVAASANPFHPQGFSQHGETSWPADKMDKPVPRMGRSCYLGKRIPFESLPKDVQKLVIQDLSIQDECRLINEEMDEAYANKTAS